MKVRTGFVSNSSSSSFVVRGVEIGTKELARLISEKRPAAWQKARGQMAPDSEDIGDFAEAIGSYSWQTRKVDGFVCEGTKFFFSRGTVDESFVIGLTMGELDDGQVIRLPEPDDDRVRQVIKRHTGLEPEKLATFVQFISNDNW
jgi:hypothetical protein